MSKIIDNEIELLELFKTVWDGKVKIIVIMIITFLALSSYNKYYERPDSFEISVKIKSSDYTEFVKFISINKFFNGVHSNSSRRINQQAITERFIKEYQDYDEYLSVIKNSKIIKKEISNLSENDKKKKLYSYTSLLHITQPTIEDKYHILTLTWPDSDDGQNILKESLELTIQNLEKSVFKELSDFLSIKKNSTYVRDLQKISYLTEQRNIAKQLNIDEDLNRTVVTKPNFLFNFEVNDDAYYLKGFNVIDKEIEAVKDRTYVELESIDKEIELLKKDKVNWVDYNIFLAKILKLENPNEIKNSLSIAFGLIIGLIYVFVSSVIKSRKV